MAADTNPIHTHRIHTHTIRINHTDITGHTKKMKMPVN